METASRPGRRRQHAHAAPLERARQREDVARVVVDHQHGAAGQHLVGAVQALQHALLVLGQVLGDLVQEERGLVEQPLGRGRALDHDRARHGVQLGVLLGRQVAAGEHHHRQVGQGGVVLYLLQHLEARQVGQAQVEHHAVEALRAQLVERAAAGIDGGDLDVGMRQQLGDAEALGLVVLGDQELLLARPHVVVDARQRRVQPFAGRRLVEVGEGAARQALLAVLVHAQDLHRDVARLERALELAEHVPAQHVGQEDVERHGDGLVLQREVERLRAARRHHGLQVRGMGGIDQDAGIVGIVLDDQQGAVARLDGVAVVGELVGEMVGQGDLRQRQRARQRLAQRRARAGVHGRQVEREGAAEAGRAAQRRARRPAAAASSRLMARPRPVPPYLRLVLASACWKASNTIFCFSTGMPTPVSVTSKATTALAWLSATLSARQPVWAGTTRRRTLPWAVNFSALLSRFFRICCRRLESVTMLRPRCVVDLRPRTTGPAIRPGGGTAAPRSRARWRRRSPRRRR